MVQSLDLSQGRAGGVATDPPAAPATFTGNRALQIEEPLIFEMGQAGRCGVDLPEPPKVKDRLNGLRRAGEIGLPGLSRAAGGAALHAAQPEELRHRHGRLSAGLVHHEAQSPHQREGGAPGGHRRPPSAAAGLDGAGRARADRQPGALAQDADRHAGRGDVAGRRRAWRDVRHDGDRRRPRGPRRAAQRKVVLAPESAHGTNPATAAALGFTVKPIPANDRGRVDLARAQGRPRPRRGGDHADQPQHLRPVRIGDRRDLPGRARGGRLLLLRRRQLQRHRRPGAAGRPRRRLHAHQPAQDLLDAAWRRRAGRRSGGAVGGAGALCALSVDREGRREVADRRGRCGGRRHAARTPEGLPRPDGHVHPRAGLHHEPRRRRAEAGRRGRGADRQLRDGRARRTS